MEAWSRTLGMYKYNLSPSACNLEKYNQYINKKTLCNLVQNSILRIDIYTRIAEFNTILYIKKVLNNVIVVVDLYNKQIFKNEFAHFGFYFDGMYNSLIFIIK